MKRLLVPAAVVGASILVALLLGEIALRMMGFSAPVWYRPDPQLGWTQIHKEAQIDGQVKFASISADGDRGPIDADYDLYNGPQWNVARNAEPRGWRATPVYDAGFAQTAGSPGHGVAERIPNFNDQYAGPDVGAQQSGAPRLLFGLEAAAGR